MKLYCKKKYFFFSWINQPYWFYSLIFRLTITKENLIIFKIFFLQNDVVCSRLESNEHLVRLIDKNKNWVFLHISFYTGYPDWTTTDCTNITCCTGSSLEMDLSKFLRNVPSVLFNESLQLDFWRKQCFFIQNKSLRVCWL